MFSRIRQAFLSHKKIIFFGVILCFFGAILFVYTIPKNEEVYTGPTEVQIIDTSPLTFSPEPVPGEVAIGGTKIGISLFFDGMIDVSSLEFDVFPPFELAPKVLADYPDRVILLPSRPWQAGITYRITIKKEVQTEVSGRTLSEDVTLEYKVIEAPDIEEVISPHL